MNSAVITRLEAVGWSLPRAEVTKYDYLPLSIHERTAYLAGQIPKVGNDLLYAGTVGIDITMEQAQSAARVCVLQGLSWLDACAGGLENVERVLRLDVYLAMSDTFEQMSEVADAASGLLAQAFGECGRHPRSVLGVRRLPRNSPVLLEMTFALKKNPGQLASQEGISK